MSAVISNFDKEFVVLIFRNFTIYLKWSVMKVINQPNEILWGFFVIYEIVFGFSLCCFEQFLAWKCHFLTNQSKYVLKYVLASCLMRLTYFTAFFLEYIKYLQDPQTFYWFFWILTRLVKNRKNSISINGIKSFQAKLFYDLNRYFMYWYSCFIFFLCNENSYLSF